MTIKHKLYSPTFIQYFLSIFSFSSNIFALYFLSIEDFGFFSWVTIASTFLSSIISYTFFIPFQTEHLGFGEGDYEVLGRFFSATHVYLLFFHILSLGLLFLSGYNFIVALICFSISFTVFDVLRRLILVTVPLYNLKNYQIFTSIVVFGVSASILVLIYWGAALTFIDVISIIHFFFFTICSILFLYFYTCFYIPGDGLKFFELVDRKKCVSYFYSSILNLSFEPLYFLMAGFFLGLDHLGMMRIAQLAISFIIPTIHSAEALYIFKERGSTTSNDFESIIIKFLINVKEKIAAPYTLACLFGIALTSFSEDISLKSFLFYFVAVTLIQASNLVRLSYTFAARRIKRGDIVQKSLLFITISSPFIYFFALSHFASFSIFFLVIINFLYCFLIWIRIKLDHV